MIPAPGAIGAVHGGSAGADPRLRPAAHEFEACLMKELLQPMQHDELFSDDENSGEGSGSALMSFGSEGLAKAISDRGGFGIASKILAHFAGESAAAPPVDGPGKNLLRMGRKV